jgi:hypothetical protein
MTAAKAILMEVFTRGFMLPRRSPIIHSHA